MPSSPHEKQLQAVLSLGLDGTLDEKLSTVDEIHRVLGQFVYSYATFPVSLGLAERSSYREDSAIDELARQLETSSDDVIILDVCSGLASLAARISSAAGARASRIHYYAIDGSPECHKYVKHKSTEYAHFGKFTSHLREITDIEVCQHNSADLIILNNALHEIPPRHFPRVLESFNSLLKPITGRACLVDMSQLPKDAPESIAITWTQDEIEAIVKTAGFECVATSHIKQVTIFRIVVGPKIGSVNTSSLNQKIAELLRRKLKSAISKLRQVDATRRDTVTDMQEWVLATGTVARLAEELDHFEATTGTI